MNNKNNVLVWMRRDLRLEDHHALAKAISYLHDCKKTRPTPGLFLAFVFDQKILESLSDKFDRRITFIIQGLEDIQSELKKLGGQLIIKYGNPVTAIPQIVEELNIGQVYLNRDYEPYAVQRDKKVCEELEKINVEVLMFKDHVILEKHQVLTQQGQYYKVFTPYKRQWELVLSQNPLEMTTYPIDKNLLKKFLSTVQNDMSPSSLFELINFSPSNSLTQKGGRTHALHHLKAFQKKIGQYHNQRDFPHLQGTSSLSPYIRHGMISIREMLHLTSDQEGPGPLAWRNELIWREFYQMILAAFPHVAKEAFQRDCDKIRWPGKKEHFEKWCQGQTGVPIVDAAMRCLNQTGLMPNRLRMVTASYLCKILLVDWKWGEQYFAQKLLDFDLAANNGGWQWCASTGCDAQPYFRIFNPYNQSRRFDPEGQFIRHYCPELKNFSSEQIHRPEELDFFTQVQAECVIGEHYPHPLMTYEDQRQKAVLLFQNIKKS